MRLRHLVVALALAGASSVAGAQNVTYDLIIRGGRIVDGTGAPSYRADLAVSNGWIAAAGRSASGLWSAGASGLRRLPRLHAPSRRALRA